MVELVDATSTLLAGGTTSFDGEHFCLVDAALDHPRPVRQPIPLLVGGNGSRVLCFAGRTADIVGITGLGRTLADGHRHEVDWSRDAVRQSIQTVRSAADNEGVSPEIEALVQAVIVTDDAPASAEGLTDVIPGASVDDLLEAPLSGSARSMRSQESSSKPPMFSASVAMSSVPRRWQTLSSS